jgi:hypothetical protein
MATIWAEAELGAQAFRWAWLIGHTINPNLSISIVCAIGDTDGMSHFRRPLQICPTNRQMR